MTEPATTVTDAPAPLTFVDPNEADATFRVCLWAEPGAGKSVAAATAPRPIVVLSADRPGAYRFARHFHGLTAADLRESRFLGGLSLNQLYRYVRDNRGEIRTVVLDPFTNIYDRLVKEAPRRGDGEPDYLAANDRIIGFLHSLREFDVNVVLVAHEKINDGKKGDGKTYPALGGPALINKILAECDIVAHVEREPGADDQPARYVAQLAPRGSLVCKESTGVLGERRDLDLTEWFATAAQVTAPAADDSDLPWAGGGGADPAATVTADSPPAVTPPPAAGVTDTANAAAEGQLV